MKKALFFVMIICMLSTFFVGCSSDTNVSQNFPGTPYNPDDSDQTSSTAQTTKNDYYNETTYVTEPSTDVTQESVDTTKAPDPIVETPNYFVSSQLEKIAATTDSIYYFNGKSYAASVGRSQYVLKSVDQTKTIDKVFVKVEMINDNFIVTEKNPENTTDFDGINSTGLINPDLEQIIPCEYALIKKLDDKFVIAYKATDVTANTDESILYITSNIFSLTPETGDTFYKGEWCIINVATGKKLEGIGGTHIPTVYTYGNVIESTLPDKSKLRIDIDGNVLPENITLLSNGCYIPNGEYAVYSSNGTKLFEYDKNITVSGSYNSEKYFIQYIYDRSTSKTKYQVIDKTGTAVSVEFDKYINIFCDTFVSVSESGTYLFDGTKVADQSISLIDRVGSYYILSTYKDFAKIMDLQFNTVLELTGTSLHTDRQNLLIGMDDENYKTTYYSVPQKDYVYDGYGVAPWIIKIKDGDSNNHKLINVLTDEELLSGCYVFSSYTDKNGNVYFIVSYEDQKICYRLKQ